jgi:hypothetical protein
MSAIDFIDRVKQFVSSIGVYDPTSAFLVPSYGNGDLPQAFARAAAVTGAVQILGCDIERVKQEVGEVVRVAEACASQRSVVHRAIIIGENHPTQVLLTMEIIPPESLEGYPVMCLHRSVDGKEVLDCFSFMPDMQEFKRRLDHHVAGHSHVAWFSASIDAPVDPLRVFCLEAELDDARETVNRLLGRDIDTPLSLGKSVDEELE